MIVAFLDVESRFLHPREVDDRLELRHETDRARLHLEDQLPVLRLPLVERLRQRKLLVRSLLPRALFGIDG